MRALELTDFRAAVARLYLESGDLADFRARIEGGEGWLDPRPS